jgi:SpoVK/Ycf46/Vps4 family AAA+-type ATPase
MSVVLTSKTVGLSAVRDFVARCVEQDDERKRAQNAMTRKVFEFKGVRSSEALWSDLPFQTTKSFDNMFFEDKDRLLARIDAFPSARGEYERLGIPYTLGFLLVGEPGTGKTSFIKSLARRSNRHILVIPAKDISNRETLIAAFRSEHLEDCKIPFDERLYVFEDIDCCDWRDVILSRDLKERSSSSNDGFKGSARPQPAEALVKVMMETLRVRGHTRTRSSRRKKDRGDDDDYGDDDDDDGGDDDGGEDTFVGDKNTTAVTLADLLELLDGIIEMPGRMLVMTSNRPDEIDPALIRAGRIDEVVRFGPLSASDTRKMYHAWFGEGEAALSEPPENQEDTGPISEALRHGGLTQAELGALFNERRFKVAADEK